MRYRFIGLISCIFVLLLAYSATILTGNDKDRVHQHQEALKPSCSHDDDAFCSHLPLVQINTGGAVIPGKPIYDESGRRTGGFVLSEDGTDSIRGTIDIIDHQDTRNHFGDTPVLTSLMEIRIRGNSSRDFDKSSYRIDMIHEDGSNNSQTVMGMDAHHEWILYGPYLDKTLIRNYMWYNIAGEIMDYAPNVRFCEVSINGEYRGLYVMMESITAGDDGARLNLTVNRDNNTFAGYLLRLDRNFDEPEKNLTNFTAYTLRTKQTVEVVYPGRKNFTNQIRHSIQRDFSDFEKALYSYDYNDKKHGYDSYIDYMSFVDYFLINEITCNYDAGWMSTYMYKDLNGLYKMCIWDFNSACNNYQHGMEIDGFQMQDTLWYFMLIKDVDFTDQIIRRYKALRKTYFSDEYLYGYIEDVISYLGESIERNYDIWGYSFEEEYDFLIPSERNPRNYEDAISQLKEFLAYRIEWMDNNIEALRQYSAHSKVKKFDIDAN